MLMSVHELLLILEIMLEFVLVGWQLILGQTNELKANEK